jgi:hypothetical protein
MMKHVDERCMRRLRPAGLGLAGMAVLVGTLLATGSVLADPPDMSIGQRHYPDADAIILKWDQQWTLDDDGTVHRRDHQWIKLLNRRPIRATADPRIDFNANEDDLLVHTARTHLPDGSTIEVPDYSFNRAGPSDVAGWPLYIDWEQMVVSFSGIVPGCVLELDYEVATQPGFAPWMEGDVRLDDTYPVVQRTVTVRVPKGTKLEHKLERAGPYGQDERRDVRGNHEEYVWTFAKLPADASEPQSPAWQDRCPRLRFTTVDGWAAWTSAHLGAVSAAAGPGRITTDFVQKVVGEEQDPRARIELITKKLHDSYNPVTSPKSMRSLNCRQAAEVLNSNYGNPLETGALCTSLLRSLGMVAYPVVATSVQDWYNEPPTASTFAGILIRVDRQGEPIFVHPTQGIIASPGSWGKHWVLAANDAGQVEATYLRTRTEGVLSDLRIVGSLEVDDGGSLSGTVRIEATGGFYDPQHLETSGAQAGFVRGLIGRVLSDMNVKSHSISLLSDERLRATAEVKSDGALPKLGGQHRLEFGEGPAFLGSFGLPLQRSSRTEDVQLAGVCRTYLDLTIELPEGWSPAIVPVGVDHVESGWGSLEQRVSVDGQTLHLRRQIELTSERIGAEQFAELRAAVNKLRATNALLFAFGKK